MLDFGPKLRFLFGGPKDNDRAEEHERINELCRRVQAEKDPKIFDQLVKELNDLLEHKHERIHPEYTRK